MRYLFPGPPPCPEVVAVFYIRLAEVPTLFSVEGDTQVEQQNTVVGFLTAKVGMTLSCSQADLPHQRVQHTTLFNQEAMVAARGHTPSAGQQTLRDTLRDSCLLLPP